MAAAVDVQHLARDIARILQQEAHGQRPITEIALSCGFSNLSHFSRVFREHTGRSPSEFRTSLSVRA